MNTVELDERKREILRSVVIDYIHTAEPVSSRTLARRHHLGFSPATIRNEMADLEDFGFLEQPHTSAGRVPSDKGYRFYVNELMDPAELTLTEAEAVRQRMMARLYEVQEVIRESSRILNAFTRYTSVALAPSGRRRSYQHLKLVPLDGERLLLVLVTDPGFVANRLARVEKVPDTDELAKLSTDLTRVVKSRAAGEIGPDVKRQIQDVTGVGSLAEEVISLLEQAGQEDAPGGFFVEGATAILEQPEFRDLERVRSFLGLFEGGNVIAHALEDLGRDSGNVVVVIGSENPRGPLQDLGIVAAGYESSGEIVGTLGVIGPKRMDYQRAVSLVGCVARHLSESLAALLRGR